jgi:hypothetical protein
MMETMNNTRFVKIHPNLGCMLSATEVAFLVLLLDQKFYKDMGYSSTWSRTYFQKSMKIGNEAFVKCVTRLSNMGILSMTDNNAGCKKEYSLNLEAYHIALRILDTTNNRAALSKFCDENFIEKHRTLGEISEEELGELAKTKKFSKQSTLSVSDKLLSKPCLNPAYFSETLSEADTLLTEPCPNQTRFMGALSESDNPVRDLDVTISTLLAIRQSYMPESDKLSNEPCLKPTWYNEEKDVTLSETDILLSKACLKPTSFCENKIQTPQTLSESDNSIEYIYNNIIISLKEYFKEEFKELNKEIKEDIKKLNKKGYEVSFFTKDKDRGVGEGETKNLQFEVQAQTSSFEEKDSSSPFTPSFEKIEEKDSDAPSIPSFKKEEEETLQSGIPQTPSPNQKFIDMLIRDMMEEYPEGDTPKWMEVKKTFSELKEDYFSHDEELSRLEIEDLFPYFESRGCRVGIHYSEWKEKTEEEIREEFMSLPVSENYDESLISLSDDEKIEMIKEDFRESFPVDEKVTLDEMRQFVVEYMRDLELLRVGRVQYDNPQLLSFMFPELQMDKKTKLWYRSQNKARGETICGDGGKMIEIQLKFREEAENARKQENPFYKKLEKYRFPRISIGENRDCQAIEIIPKLLSDMGYKNGDMEDWDTISQLLDVVIDRYKLYGSGFEPFRGIWVYLDKYDHKQKGKVQVRNLPEK